MGPALLDSPDLQKLHVDEKVEWMGEKAEGNRWKQRINLVRGGEMKQFIFDMGSIILHPHWKPFNFPAYGLYSVGEALEIAESLRNNKDPEEHEPINLALSYLRQCEEKIKRRDHVSTFGRYINRQRG